MAMPLPATMSDPSLVEPRETDETPTQGDPLGELVDNEVKTRFDSLRSCKGSSAWEEHHELLLFVRDEVWQKCMAISNRITAEIVAEHERLLQSILMREEQRNHRWAQLAGARRQKREKQSERQRICENAGMRLGLLRLEAAEKTRSAQESGEDLEPRTIREIEGQIPELTHGADCETPIAYQRELSELFRVPWDQKHKRRFADCPLSMNFGLLLTCISRQALDIARNFIPFPSYNTL
jgi:hypothetical protein